MQKSKRMVRRSARAVIQVVSVPSNIRARMNIREDPDTRVVGSVTSRRRIHAREAIRTTILTAGGPRFRRGMIVKQLGYASTLATRTFHKSKGA